MDDEEDTLWFCRLKEKGATISAFFSAPSSGKGVFRGTASDRRMDTRIDGERSVDQVPFASGQAALPSRVPWAISIAVLT